MCVRCLGFVLFLWFPGVLHAQTAAQPCPAPRLDDGYLVPKQELYRHGAKLSYACDKGHKPAVEGWWATSVCENGKWSHQPQCISEKACIHPTIPNAKHPDNSSSWYEERHLLIIKCNTGYEPEDTVVTCMNGTWTPEPVCEKRIDTCGEPPQMPHAVIVDRGYQEVFAAGSKVQYECEAGFTTEGTNTQKSIVCSSGKWSEGPECRSPTSSGSSGGGHGQSFATIDVCGNIPVIPHGDVVQTGVRSVKYQCANYYKLVGPAVVACYRDGIWSEVPTCKADFCSVDTDAYVELKSVGMKYIKYGEKESLECTDVWMADNFSVAECINGRLTLSRCCNRYQIFMGTC